jgi:2-oxoglutarate dehydrogenase E1 component
VITEDEIKKMDKDIFNQLDEALEKAKNESHIFIPDRPLAYSQSFYEKNVKTDCHTPVSLEKIKSVVKGITQFPENFALNPKLEKQIKKRSEVFDNVSGIDWAFAEALAFGTLLLEGTDVRLSGQDSARGTFSQRHLILTDMNDGTDYIPLNNLSPEQAKIEPLDSLLSENAVLGFEFGYSAADPLALVMWEAQFGDFANGAQVIIDNFIVNAEKKWNSPNNLVLLLPHGQEGQGPEHSSARIERFLTLCAENNIFVAYPTSPSQYFHLLRRQICNRIDKPLIVFTPKSLLRLPAAQSNLTDLTEGKFEEVIEDVKSIEKKNVKRLIVTSGKVYYDLLAHREKQNIYDISILRIEQLYPFPKTKLKNIVDSYSELKEIYFVQEEPKNMGMWNFFYPKLMKIINDIPIRYIGRDENSSPASGSSKLHFIQQEKIIHQAFEQN